MKIANLEVKEPKVEKDVKMITKSKAFVTSNPKNRDNPKKPQFCHHFTASGHTLSKFLQAPC